MRLLCGVLGAVLAITLGATSLLDAQETAPPPAPAENQAAPNPVVEAFRAYRDAIDRDDKPAALAAAERAWTTSTARDGAGGSTGVLAYNYAALLLDVGDPKLALAPARAAEAAAAAGVRGLDRNATRALLGRAMLAQDQRDGEALIAQAIAAANPTDDDQAQWAYDAALMLAKRMTVEDRWSDSASMWEAVERFAYGDDRTRRKRRALALIGRANALSQYDRLQAAYTAANTAIAVISPIAPETIGPTPSEEELILAAAVGWHSSLRAFSIAQGRPFPRSENVPRPQMAPPMCPFELSMPNNRARYFPNREELQGEVGGVTLRVAFDADGKPTRAVAIATVGTQKNATRFVQSAIRFALDSRIVRSADAPANCRLQTDSILFPVAFTYR